MATHDFASNIQPFRDIIKDIKSIEKLVVRTDEEFLMRFLKTAKNNLPKAVKRYEGYYNVLSSLPKAETVLSGDPKKYQWVIENMQKFINPDEPQNETEATPTTNTPGIAYSGTDANNCHIITSDTGKVCKLMLDDDLFDASMYLTVILLDHLLEKHPDCYEEGLISIESQADFGWEAAKAMMGNSSKMKLYGQLMDGTIPIRFKKCFIVDGPKFLTVVWNFLKVFLSQKMIDKCDFVSGSESVKEYLGGEDYLPELFGGKNKVAEMNFDLEEQLRKAFPRYKEQDSSVEF